MKEYDFKVKQAEVNFERIVEENPDADAIVVCVGKRYAVINSKGIPYDRMDLMRHHKGPYVSTKYLKIEHGALQVLYTKRQPMLHDWMRQYEDHFINVDKLIMKRPNYHVLQLKRGDTPIYGKSDAEALARKTRAIWRTARRKRVKVHVQSDAQEKEKRSEINKSAKDPKALMDAVVADRISKERQHIAKKKSIEEQWDIIVDDISASVADGKNEAFFSYVLHEENIEKLKELNYGVEKRSNLATPVFGLMDTVVLWQQEDEEK